MSGKVVVVTGASSGIGATLAKTLASQGAKVVLAARSLEGLRAVAADCGNEDQVLVQQCDVTKREDHEALLSAALEKFGVVDSWVNNAGVGISKPTIDLVDEDIDMMISANTKSVIYGMQTSVRYFKTTGKGQVINVSSFLARVPAASTRAMYSASKAAVNSLTANMRMDMAAEGFHDIHVALFSPGVVATPFGANAVHGGIDNGKLPGAQDVNEVATLLAQMIADPAARVDVYSRPAYKDAVVNYLSADDIRDVEAQFPRPARPASATGRK